jgi:DNA-binding transcriptional MerR regulator
VPTYALNDLARLAEVTPRTIRYYIQQGLLPSPDLQGPGTRYTDEHLERLLLIKRLQAAHLPLAEIRAQLGAVPREQLSGIAEAVAQPPTTSAVDYIRNLLEAPAVPSMRGPTEVPPPMLKVSLAESEPRSTTPERSQWERIPLDLDVELHIRRPLTRNNNKRVERLIRIARELFEED